MPIQSLPQEVAEVVVKFLPSKKDQSSMSLVSTYFLSLARPILFSSVRLPKVLSDHAWYEHKQGPNPRDYEDFVTFLTLSPELSLLIRELTLREFSDYMEDIDYELGPLSLDLLDRMLSKLPSLRSLELRSVMFKTSDTSVPYRYDGIDRLAIYWPLELGDIVRPLAFFSHVCKLELPSFSIPGLQKPPEPFEQMLKTFAVSNVFSDKLQVSDIYLNGEFWSQEAVAKILLRTATPRTLRSLSAYCDTRTEKCHVSPAVFDLLRQAAETLTNMTLESTHRQPFPEYVPLPVGDQQRDEQRDDQRHEGDGVRDEQRNEEDGERGTESDEDIGGEVRGGEDEEIVSNERGDESDGVSDEEINEEIEDSEDTSFPSIVTPHDSSDDELPDITEGSNDDKYPYPKFDSHELRTHLSRLTSLRSLTLKFHFEKIWFGRYWDTLSACSEAFAQMVPILASFPPCLRHITFSFAGCRIWPNNLRLLVLLLPRFEQLESVVFEGAEGIAIDIEENERVLNDLPEFRGLIRFRE